MDLELTLPATGGELRAVEEPSEVPRTIGRYTTLDRLGAGATGVVFSAYDPKLDRRVAVKLLKWHGGRRGREALLAEARALARLDHPNVVTVHDVGELGARAFIAMAFVDGPTLRGWTAELPAEDWRSRVDVFIAAGRGLAAAHQAGIVHRDFKPDNVIVDRHGQPRVVDFGLALLAAGPVSEEDVHDGASETVGTAGTPAYMAPELMQGATADERSDQYSFCVSLYEAIYGKRPFDGVVSALAADGAFEVPTTGSVPAHILRAIVRGLKAQPEERWPSMTALLDALEADPNRARNRWLVAGLGIIAVAVCSASVATAVKDGTRCDGGADRIASAWSDDHRQRVAQAIESTGLPFARVAAERVLADLDGYANRWASAHDDACEAHARGEQSGAMLDLRMACLGRLEHSLGSVVAELESATTDDVVRLEELLENLEPTHRCRDADALKSVHPLPADPAARAEIESVERELAELRASAWFRRAGDAARMDQSATIVERAEQTQYPPLVARAYMALGELHESNDRQQEAVDAFERSWRVASTTGQPFAAANAAVNSVRILGFGLRRFEAVEVRAEDARAFLERARANHAESVADLELALALALARAELRKPDGGRAGALAQKVVAGLEAEGATDKPAMTVALEIQGWAALLRHDFAEARIHYERGLERLEARLGPDHPGMATAHNSLGLVLKNEERFADAAHHLERALSILEDNGMGSAPHANMFRRNLGFTYLAQKNDEAALEQLDAAFEQRPPPPGLLMQHQFIEYTRALKRVGRVEDAQAWLEEALRAAELADDVARQAKFFRGECESALDHGWPEIAVAIGERGLAAMSQRDVAPEDWARLAAALAESLRQRGEVGDESRAERLDAEATVILEAGDKRPGP